MGSMAEAQSEKLIGIDLGGTHIKAVLTNNQGDILHELSRPTQDIQGKDNSKVWKNTVKTLIQEIEDVESSPLHVVAISSPGTVNSENSEVISNGNKLLGIEGLNWTEFLGRKVYVLNDAHSALFAESRIGAGVGFNDILMVTLGTGIGGGIMIDRKIIQGQMGRAGHIGHVSVNSNPEVGIVGTPGSLENTIGECTIVDRTKGRFSSTKELVEAHLRGESFASWVWLNSVESLARGISSFINILSPQIILVGGGIANAGDTLMTPLKDFLELYEWRPGGFKTPIEFAKLSNHAGAIGAALFAYEQTNKA